MNSNILKLSGIALITIFTLGCEDVSKETATEEGAEMIEEVIESTEDAVESSEGAVTEAVEGVESETSEALQDAASTATGASDFSSFFENGSTDFSGSVFEFGETSTDGKTLSEEAKTMFNQVAEVMIANPNATIDVRGHTRKVGTELANKASSKVRAILVQSYLKEKGVEGNRIDTKGRGSADLLADTAEDDMAQKRISIVLTAI